MVLNVYPLEQSLRHLAEMFGAVSSNRENILVFVTMLKSLRFTFDSQELVRRPPSYSLVAYGELIATLPRRKRRCKSFSVTTRRGA